MLFFSHKCGQLGNRLFAFAHLIAFAKANNYTIVNLSFDEYAKHFETTSQDVLSRYPSRETIFRSNWLRNFLFTINRAVLKVLRITGFYSSPFHRVIIADLPEYDFEQIRFCELDSEQFRINSRRPITILFGRFFRDFENLKKYQSEVKAFFKPKSAIQSKIENISAELRRDNPVLIGVHIRRGDYKEYKGGLYFYNQCQYRDKMLELVKLHLNKKFRFVICSNEQVDQSIFSDLDCRTGPGALVEDLYLLAVCDYIMGPPSTFSRWASFIGDVPLFQIETLTKPISLGEFKLLPPTTLYNF